jgi:hypothetical protein
MKVLRKIRSSPSGAGDQPRLFGPFASGSTPGDGSGSSRQGPWSFLDPDGRPIDMRLRRTY